MKPEQAPFRERARLFWRKHRTLFWMVHTVWALATGVAVVLLARERYGFVPWVLAFLGITWLSTMFFGSSPEVGAGEYHPGLRTELTSYVTRTLYQETLFFLLPFYAYSTVLASPNVVFLVLLGGLALLSCLDLVFDRWLRTSPVFGLIFFAIVAYAAINLIVPMVSGIDPELANPIAAGAAVASGAPLALRSAATWAQRLRLAVAAAVILVVPIAAPVIVPPVPLRLDAATFAGEIDRETLALSDTLRSGLSAATMQGAMIVLVEVFAPAAVPTTVTLEWRRDGESFRTSAEVEIVAHEAGFRIWDGWRPDPPAGFRPGLYEVTLRTHGGRVFGVTRLAVTGT